MLRRLTTVFIAALSLTLFLFFAVGCSVLSSPAVGKWSGPMKSSPQGGIAGALITGVATATIGDAPANLELKSNGTGYLKLPSAPERPITWKSDGDKILLSGVGSSNTENKSTSGTPNPTASDEPIIGTLSEDKKTLTFDLGPIQFVMTKQDK